MSTGATRLAEVQVAVMLLTRLPAGRIAGDAPDLKAARWAFPLVGILLGALAWGIHAGALTLGFSPVTAALLTISGLAAVTGALHLDGVADFADGIGGGRDRQHCLEIMKDSRLGSYGALMLIFVVALWASALSDVAGAAGLAHFIAIGALSRTTMVILLEVLPQARDGGLGAMASGSHRTSLAVSGFLALMAIALLGTAGLVLLLSMGGVTLAVGWVAHRRIGGQTGDVLGAVQCLSEVAGWLCLSVVAIA